MSKRLYSIGTWDSESQSYTPHDGLPAFNLTIWQLRRVMRALRSIGYPCDRKRDSDGGHDSNDPNVLIERTDGMAEDEILDGWRR